MEVCVSLRVDRCAEVRLNLHVEVRVEIRVDVRVDVRVNMRSDAHGAREVLMFVALWNLMVMCGPCETNFTRPPTIRLCAA